MTVDNTLEEYFRVAKLYHQTREEVWMTILSQMAALSQEHPRARRAAALAVARSTTRRERLDTS